MPALPVQCPRCTGLFQLDSAWFGQRITCPLCHAVVVISREITSGDTTAAECGDLLPPVRSLRLAERPIASDNADWLPPPVPISSEAREPPAAYLLPPGALGPASAAI